MSAPDFHYVLAEILSLLRRIAVWQSLGDKADQLEESADVVRLGTQLSPEDCQLFYQIGLIGRRDLALAPDPQSGFEMVLLRMLAFRPLDSNAQLAREHRATDAGPIAVKTEARQATPESARPPVRVSRPQTTSAPAERPPRTMSEPAASKVPQAVSTQSQESAVGALKNLDWSALVGLLQLQGLAGELARNAAIRSYDGHTVELVVAAQHENLKAGSAVKGLEAALKEQLDLEVRLRLSVTAEQGLDTPSKRLSEAEQARQLEAERIIDEDPMVRVLQDEFGATIEHVLPK